MQKFLVYDNGKPARYPECDVERSWDNNVFLTFLEAVNYKNIWLAKTRPLMGNNSYNYFGFGKSVQIHAVG